MKFLNKTPSSEELVDQNKFACFFSCVKYKLKKLNGYFLSGTSNFIQNIMFAQGCD